MDNFYYYAVMNYIEEMITVLFVVKGGRTTFQTNK